MISDQLLRLEPQSDLIIGALHTVASVNDVPSDVDAVVASDGAWQTVERLGLAQHLAADCDGVHALPHHAAHGAHLHVLHQAREEGTRFQVRVMSFKKFLNKLYKNNKRVKKRINKV